MLNPHQLLKATRKAGTARTDQDQTFKKPFQTVGRPPTVDHNMHDDFFRNPPNVHVSNVSCCRGRLISPELCRAPGRAPLKPKMDYPGQDRHSERRAGPGGVG
jgi:hypothetical protein